MCCGSVKKVKHFQLYTFLKDGEMPLDSIFSWINGQLQWGNYTPPIKSSKAEDLDTQLDSGRQESGLKVLWNDLTSLIPADEALIWYLEMLAVNPDMQVKHFNKKS